MESLVTPSFWKNKKVLITGHTGFKGGWLTCWLKQLQADVVGYSLEPPTTINFFSVANVAKGLIDIREDVRNFAALKEAIFTHKPEIIFHLAAQSLVKFSYSNPIDTYATNVMGTVNLLEAARQVNCTYAIINITTDKCYENKEWYWGYRENDPMGGYDPYSNSKGCAELVTSAFRNSYFSNNRNSSPGLATARAGNVIGGGDWGKDRLIPDLIAACINNQSATIRFPHATRPWQHVLEPISGYLRLAEKLYQQPQEYAEAWNFGPNDEAIKPVSWITEKVMDLWGNKNNWILSEHPDFHEATYLKLDCSKAHSKIQWNSKLNINQALEATIYWYKAHINHLDMEAVTLKQISEYVSLI